MTKSKPSEEVTMREEIDKRVVEASVSNEGFPYSYLDHIKLVDELLALFQQKLEEERNEILSLCDSYDEKHGLYPESCYEGAAVKEWILETLGDRK